MQRPLHTFQRTCFVVILVPAIGIELMAYANPAAPPTAIAQLSEREAIETLKAQSLDLLARKHELSEARALVVAAAVLPNPELSIGGGVLLHGRPSGGMQELSVGLEQPLPITGAVGARTRAALGFQTSAERAFAASAWTLVCDMRALYLQVQLAEAKVRAATLAKTRMEHLVDIIDQRAKAGANPTYDRLRVRVELRKLEAKLTGTTSAVALARAELAKILGETEAARPFVLSELPEPESPAAELNILVARAQTRPDLQAQTARASAVGLSAAAIGKSYLPTPRLGIGYSVAFGIPTEPQASTGGMISAQLSLPLPLFDHGQGAVQQRLAEADKEHARAGLLRQNILHDVAAAVTVATLQFNAYITYRESALIDATQMRDIAELSYREGRATILELVDAYGAYSEAQERGLELRAEALLRQRELTRVVGPSSL